MSLSEITVAAQQKNRNGESQIKFQDEKVLETIMRRALSHLSAAEAQRRLFLVVSISFHSIAGICRAEAIKSTASVLSDKPAMFEQLVCTIESLISAPSRI